MDKISVKVLRDLANNPSIVEIMKNNRKITATFDPTTGLVLEGPAGHLPSVAEILQMAYPFEMPSFARPAWYDRNPQSKADLYLATVEGHALTKRLEYTVPSDKKALVEVLCIEGIRTVAGAGVDWIGARIALRPAGGATTVFLAEHIHGNTVGDKLKTSLGATMPLQEDDKISVYTLDNTGAASRVQWTCGYKLTEFDA